MKKPRLKIKKLKKPKLPKKLPKSVSLPPVLEKTKSAEERVSAALENVPRITNETVGEHREEVLSSARKHIYPLQHSKRSVVRISLALLALVIISFFTLTSLTLYKFQGTSTFIYDVTRILPFPVAKTGGHWVSYESYLFELRRNMHYYHTQQQTDFSSRDGKDQLKHLKQQAMSQVILDSYVKQLAAQNHVSVSEKAVSRQVDLVRAQNRLGSNDRVFKEVLSEFWGWSEADFRRELKQQMLQQAVVAKLDTGTNQRAQSALQQLKTGGDFATLASQLSDDPATKANGGQYATAITPDSRDVSPSLTAAIFQLKPGQVSGVVNSGYTLEIVKLNDVSDKSAHAAHIQFNLKPIGDYTKPLQDKNPPHKYIKV